MLSKQLKAFLVVFFAFVLSGCSGIWLADSVEERYYYVLDFPKKEVFDAVVAVFPHYGFIVQSEGDASGKIIGASKPKVSWNVSLGSANIRPQPGAVGADMNSLNIEAKPYVVVNLYKKTDQSTYMSLRLTSECLLTHGELSNLEKRILNEVKRELAKNAPR